MFRTSNFQSDRPFVTFTWVRTQLDAAFGTPAPEGKDNFMWPVFFDKEKLVEAGLNNAYKFRRVANMAIIAIKPQGDLVIAPLSDSERRRIWCSAPPGKEDEWQQLRSTKAEFCDERFVERIKRLAAGESLSLQEGIAYFERGINNLGKDPMSNREAAESFAARFNDMTGIADLANTPGYILYDSYSE